MKSLLHSALFALLLAPGARATVILSDNFAGGSVSETFRIYESTIDDGWHRGPFSYNGHPASAWTITGGVAQNDSSLAATTFPNSKEAEAPIYNFFSGTAAAEPNLRLRFDYSVAAGDTLYVHLWGMTGVSDDDGEFVSNLEASFNGALNTTSDSAELTRYNLPDGASSGFGGTASSISGALTGVGTFDSTFSVASLGIGGVTTTADFTYFLIQFAKDEDGTTGTTSFDNFSLSAVPEPSALALVGCGLAVLTFCRRRL